MSAAVPGEGLLGQVDPHLAARPWRSVGGTPRPAGAARRRRPGPPADPRARSSDEPEQARGSARVPASRQIDVAAAASSAVGVAGASARQGRPVGRVGRVPADGGQLTLSPRPTTHRARAAPCRRHGTASARIPASLAPPTMRSFGHLSSGLDPGDRARRPSPRPGPPPGAQVELVDRAGWDAGAPTPAGWTPAAPPTAAQPAPPGASGSRPPPPGPRRRRRGPRRAGTGWSSRSRRTAGLGPNRVPGGPGHR